MSKTHGPKQDEKKNGFVMLPRWLFESPLLSGNERLFCLTLAYHRNNHTHLCCPGRPKVCSEASISEDTYYRIKVRLRKIGVIDYEDCVGGRKHSVEFILKWLDGSKEEIARLKAILKGKKPPAKDTGLGTINPPQRTQVNPPQRTQVNPPQRTQLTIINSNKKELQQQSKKSAVVGSSFSEEKKNHSRERTKLAPEALLANFERYGVTQKQGKEWIAQYGSQRVVDMLYYVISRRFKNPGGAMTSGLKDGWPIPDTDDSVVAWDQEESEEYRRLRQRSRAKGKNETEAKE